jgi:hypothetical protein
VCSVTNIPVLLTNRVVRWCRALDLYGYIVEMPIRFGAQPRELEVRARRPTLYGDPTVLLDIVQSVEELVFERHSYSQDEQD